MNTKGLGSVYQRESDGRWIAEVSLGRDADGKRRRKRCYAASEAEATQKLKELHRLIHEGYLTPASSMTLNAWCDQWLEDKQNEATARTIEEYGYTLRHVRKVLGKATLEELSALQIHSAMKRIDKTVSRRAAVYGLSLLGTVLSDAVRLELIPSNPASNVKPMKYERTEYPIWTGAEVLKFLEAAKEARYYAFYYTALTTGLRPGELIALHWEDVTNNQIRVSRTVSIVKNRAHLGPPKTRYGKRIVNFSDDTMVTLLEHKSDLKADRNFGKLVFPATTGNFLGHGNIKRSLDKIAEHAEVTRIRTHDLRHTHASMCIEGGMSVTELSRRLGHHSPSFTLDTYAHIFERVDKKSAPSLKDLVGQ